MKIVNKRANLDYQIFDEYEAGISLKGAEVKAIKRGGLNLTNAFVKVIGGEIFLINAVVLGSLPEGIDPSRSKKLLLHKKEIGLIASKSRSRGLTIIPIMVYTKNDLVKVRIALAKVKKKFEKRALLKRREEEREAQRILKEKNFY